MGKKSKIAEIGILNILQQMKNPLTNIRLSLEALEDAKCEPAVREYHEIIKNGAITLEASIRDLCKSFNELGVSIHIEEDITPLGNH